MVCLWTRTSLRLLLGVISVTVKERPQCPIPRTPLPWLVSSDGYLVLRYDWRSLGVFRVKTLIPRCNLMIIHGDQQADKFARTRNQPGRRKISIATLVLTVPLKQDGRE